MRMENAKGGRRMGEMLPGRVSQGKIGFVDDQTDRVSLFVVCIVFIQFLCERV